MALDKTGPGSQVGAGQSGACGIYPGWAVGVGFLGSPPPAAFPPVQHARAGACGGWG